MSDEFMLTTNDNPFDPFEQFTSWYLFDVEKGYNSCEYLAKLVEPKLSDDLTQGEINELIEKTIDEIVKYDFLNIYKKFKRKTMNN
jgi:hypothetical protein